MAPLAHTSKWMLRLYELYNLNARFINWMQKTSKAPAIEPDNQGLGHLMDATQVQWGFATI